MKLLRGSSRHRSTASLLSSVISGTEVQFRTSPTFVSRRSLKARQPKVSDNLVKSDTEPNSSCESHNRHTSSQKNKTSISTTTKRILVRVLCAVIVILVLAIISYTIIIVLQNEPDLQDSTVSKLSYAIHPVELPGGHLIFSKQHWKGQSAKYEVPLEHPTPIVVISHTYGNRCGSFSQCAQVIRSIQEYHLSLKGKRTGDSVVDIGYNFLIGGDGNIYEGRGWDVRSFHKGAKEIVGISFIGNYEKYELEKVQIEAAQELLALGVKEQKLKSDYALIAHSQTTDTASPGRNVVKVISQWPHWSPHVYL